MMDLIVADKSGTDLGIVKQFYSFDCEASNEPTVEANSFELRMPIESWRVHKPTEGHRVYIDGTEYGGIIDRIQKKSDAVTLTGATWEGMLARQMARNDSSVTAPLIQNGDGSITAWGYTRLILAALIKGDVLAADYILPLDDTQLMGEYRYETVLSVLKMLMGVTGDYGMRLKTQYNGTDKKAHLRIVPGRNLLSQINLTADYGATVEYSAGKLETYNHIHILGSGELADRIRANVWRTTDGGFTTNQNSPLAIKDDRTYIYDYNGMGTFQAAEDAGRKKLLELSRTESVAINIPPTSLQLEPCDVVSATDYDLNLELSVVVDKKILRMTPNVTRMEYQARTRSADLYFDRVQG